MGRSNALSVILHVALVAVFCAAVQPEAATSLVIGAYVLCVGAVLSNLLSLAGVVMLARHPERIPEFLHLEIPSGTLLQVCDGGIIVVLAIYGWWICLGFWVTQWLLSVIAYVMLKKLVATITESAP